MEPSNPAAPEPQHVRGSMKDAPEGTRTPERAIEQPTVLNERAYPGPTKEDLTLLNTHSVAENPQTQVTVGDVVRGFRELGKDMTTSEMLTILLRALAKDETETLFEWVLLERFRDNPPADGMGHWYVASASSHTQFINSSIQGAVVLGDTEPGQILAQFSRDV